MRRRRNTMTAAPLFVSAALSYSANCALGTAVAARIVDTSGFRWLHHALYIATCVSTAAAISTAVWAEPKRQSRRAALALLPAAAPLAAIARLGARGVRHPLVALSAAPFIAAGVICSRLPTERT